MWCLVSQANSLVLEVRVSHKATGQECLDQVCKTLGIIESDYFGLQYRGPKGEGLWLNLRNEIRQEISGGLPPFRFQLRVKFWVPPHLILQESTRHQFYLDARLELSQGRLLVRDLELAIRLTALAAQAETGDAAGGSAALQLDFYASLLPNLPWNVQVSDSNQCSEQHGSPSHGLRSFHHFHTGGVTRFDQASSVAAAQFLPSQVKKEDWILLVAQHHVTLKGMPTSVAEYWLLKEASVLEDFGTEIFSVRWMTCRGQHTVPAVVGISSSGVTVKSPDVERQLKIPYSSIQVATNSRNCFLLKYLKDSGEIERVALKLETNQASISLYRAITEKHAFYSCETVRSAVTSQFVRDLKGTIASFFNENTDLGKKYVFDIQRTCREVYDNARRILYQSGAALALLPVPTSAVAEGQDHSTCNNTSCKAMRDHLTSIREALLCRICMDNDIEVAFCPCGHAVTCLPCAQRCCQCPVCRASISHTQTIFLPLISVKNQQAEGPSGLVSEDVSLDADEAD